MTRHLTRVLVGSLVSLAIIVFAIGYLVSSVANSSHNQTGLVIQRWENYLTVKNVNVQYANIEVSEWCDNFRVSENNVPVYRWINMYIMRLGLNGKVTFQLNEGDYDVAEVTDSGYRYDLSLASSITSIKMTRTVMVPWLDWAKIDNTHYFRHVEDNNWQTLTFGQYGLTTAKAERLQLWERSDTGGAGGENIENVQFRLVWTALFVWKVISPTSYWSDYGVAISNKYPFRWRENSVYVDTFVPENYTEFRIEWGVSRYAA